jgi:hypothetical protein
MDRALGSPPAHAAPRPTGTRPTEPEPAGGSAGGDEPPSPSAPMLPPKSPSVQERMRRMQLSGGSPPIPTSPRPTTATAAGGSSPARLAGSHSHASGQLSRGLSVAEPQDALGRSPSSKYRTCVDRPFVQQEILWAQVYRKPIILLHEAEPTKIGYFDFGKATHRYCGEQAVDGGRWSFLFDIAADPYRRDPGEQAVMIDKVLKKAERSSRSPPAQPGGDPARPGGRNEPGRWDFFLSHHAQTGGGQVTDVRHLLEKAGKRCWQDVQVGDASTAAMEEGVKHSDSFVLFLTSYSDAGAGAGAGAGASGGGGGGGGGGSSGHGGGGGAGSPSSSGVERFTTVAQELKQMLEEGYLTQEQFKHAVDKASREFLG